MRVKSLTWALLFFIALSCGCSQIKRLELAEPTDAAPLVEALERYNSSPEHPACPLYISILYLLCTWSWYVLLGSERYMLPSSMLEYILIPQSAVIIKFTGSLCS